MRGGLAHVREGVIRCEGKKDYLLVWLFINCEVIG